MGLIGVQEEHERGCADTFSWYKAIWELYKRNYRVEEGYGRRMRLNVGGIREREKRVEKRRGMRGRGKKKSRLWACKTK